ncbi:MAG: hypothetical protein CL993_02780 [Euryarchaeota archaeon]|jgi:hypothetical protein|nr:hypothetical protein [Euryarchaeota archaeon]|tara:strand:- start:299 stop:481 length:183 start_codon:yes stop_codon:yes gene_type:complete
MQRHRLAEIRNKKRKIKSLVRERDSVSRLIEQSDLTEIKESLINQVVKIKSLERKISGIE